LSFDAVELWFVRQIVLILPQNWKIPSRARRERGFPSGLTQRSAMNPILIRDDAPARHENQIQ